MRFPPLNFSRLVAPLALFAALWCVPSRAADCARPSGFAALAKIRNTPPSNPLHQIKSHESRKEYVLATFRQGSPDFYGTENFARAVLDLPEAERAEWVAASAEVYRQLPKENKGIPGQGSGKAVLPGRRLLDRALTRIHSSFDYFARFTSTDLPEAELVKFFDAEAALYHTDFMGADLVATIKVFREYMRNYQRPGSYLEIAGSAVNGKASVRDSDIDLGISRLLSERGYRMVLQVDKETLTQGVHAALGANHPGAAMPLSYSSEPTPFHARFNSIVVRVYPDRVDLLVFPPAALQQGGTEIRNFAEPRIFRVGLSP